jgi:LCP family protein required for cell wall assembly
VSDQAARHRASAAHRHAVARRILIGFAVLLVIVSSAVVIGYKHLEGNITTVDISKELGNRPTAIKVSGQDQPLNVLVMGDDTRKGQGPAIGGDTPGLSDTTILLHVSANRRFAYGVSLPRDAMVQRPSCRTGSGRVDRGGITQFNAAYAIGGPACTVKTVEQLTGVHIDHFVVIKFRGFRDMVDAIGGVQVCVPQPINDNIGHITLPSGTYNVTGEQALDYVRVRHGIGSGDDIGRMKRQQTFIAAMINKVVSAGTLANPVRLYRFLNAATKSLTTDPAFAHLGELAALGSSLKNIGLDHIKFLTVPWEAYPADPNRVQWKPEANRLWHLIKYDKPVVGTRLDTDVVTAANTPGSKASPSASPSGTASSSPSTSPSGSPSPSGTPTPSAEQSANAARYGLCA